MQQNKSITNETAKNTKYADNSSKIIFENQILCAQFLRDYVPLKQLKNVKPEDIEDVSERFLHFFTEQRNADTVKRVWLTDGTPFYLISLIEHKSTIDYNVSMQILRYMVYIWEDYEKEQKKAKENDGNILISANKSFRYPPILPIVYYEGQQKWTVPKNFKWRIAQYEEMNGYIPDFNYELIQLNDYTPQELIDKKDEMSLIMMFNSLQNAESINNLLSTVQIGELEELLKETPSHILDIIANVIRALCYKMNTPKEETDKLMELVKEVKMGILFENMEHIDIQEERRKTKEALGDLEKIREEQKKLLLEITEQKEMLAQQKAELAQQKIETANQKNVLENQKTELENQKTVLENQKTELENQKTELENQKTALENQKMMIADKNAELSDISERFAKNIITTCLEKNQTREQASSKIRQELRISKIQAEHYLQKFWSGQ